MTDIEHKRNKAQKLIEGNNRTFNELKQATRGRFDMDTSDVRRELFIDHLVLWGVITEEQKLDYDLAFLEQVETALKAQWDEFKKSQTPKLTIAKEPVPKLTDKNGRPLE